MLQILIADDDQALADSLAQRLKATLDCETFAAADGLSALRLSRSNPFDAILLDYQMPGMTGVEVAHKVREHYHGDLFRSAGAAPCLIAITGQPRGLSGRTFDHVLGKPADIDRLVEILQGLERPQAHDTPTPDARRREPVDLGQVFTRVARRAVPHAVDRELMMGFDYQGPAIVVEEDPVALEAALDRLLAGLFDMFAAGYAMFGASVETDAAGACRVTVRVSGFGALESGSRIDAVLARMGLAEQTDAAPPAPRAEHRDASRAARVARADRPAYASDEEPPPAGHDVRRATGRCPHTGAQIVCTCDSREGVFLRAVLTYPLSSIATPAAGKTAAGAHAWVVDRNLRPSALGLQRLQRDGWVVTRFGSLEHPLILAGADGDGPPLPALLIVVESNAAMALQAEELARRMPAGTRCIYAVMEGSPALAAASRTGARGGYDVRIFPFSPADLAQFGAAGEVAPEAAPAATNGHARASAARPWILLVEPSEIEQARAAQVAELLGYAMTTTRSGAQAVEECLREPPSAVLLDLDGADSQGLSTACRIRDLQRSGALAPFAVLGTTANGAAEARRSCLAAGIDDVLVKPFELAVVRERLSRFANLC